MATTTKKPKTQSKKIRDRIFIIWEKTGKPGGDFDTYYYLATEKLIKKLDSKINELGG